MGGGLAGASASGAALPSVARLVAALEDLKTVAPPERQSPLDRQLHLLTAAVQRHYEDNEDVAAALTADAQGIGSGRDLAGPDDRTCSDDHAADESRHSSTPA